VIVDANFDGGNIVIVDDTHTANIELHIRSDNKADHSQWFYFRASMIKNAKSNFFITNAGHASYPEAWPTCSIVVSTDRKHWQRLDTDYKDGTLHFSYKGEADIAYFALFVPYSYEQHQDLVSWSLLQAHCELLACGQSIEHRPVELIQVGDAAKHKKNIWLISRQHPAETMAEWFIEGFLKALLSNGNSSVQALLDKATFYIVPNMNPDGSITGNLRTNAAGVDLNRAWLEPDRSTAPEVHFVFEQMKKIGVDLFLDIHGDEDIPYAFIAGAEGNPSYTDKLAELDSEFRKVFAQATADFCIDNGYDADLPLQGDLSIACNQIGEYFDCLSLTIEMPFTDNKYQKDDVHGWSPERSMQLGENVLIPISELLNKL